ncbi:MULTISPECIES: hypothetical protein [Metallosphaera]|uniref:Uncharacterized protein n=3 Tax=Metallosphaera TaxID=41980 RepID=A4YHV6_METS5|nr:MULTISPECIES: hypothetical protein [Metallosphaera]ABP96008.1 hypothetical protein Msed_1868 [Metallosphaera sedula DSM 5348]AIM27992.1 hypothetical protein HA72_1868 [Metallosphaera sedula]AKV74826.1 hypothetical protein MsedA_1912 [Metallosphaera sedula]AKV77062.1 hypothetical protein MsedB_1914 [Metallosphaera sedula]AKV79314.1 hypothetical protein MsedC_1912 [Metallosphaera sedula]
MISYNEALRTKVDYRIVEIAQSSPSTEIRAILVLDTSPSEEVLKEISSLAKIDNVFSFMMTVKVKGKASDVARLGEKSFIRYIMLDEVIARTQEWS